MSKTTTLKTILFTPKIGDKSRGFLHVRNVLFPVAIGRSGLKRDKREGDGATPNFALTLRELFFRGDKHSRPKTQLKCRKIKHNFTWEDNPKSANYNRLTLSQNPSEENLFRADNLYDFIIPLGWNDAPIHKNKGSAIFFHVARSGFSPTAGCYATTIKAFKQLLPRLSARTRILKANLPRPKKR